MVDRIERELEELEKRVTTALEVNEDEEKVQERGEEKTEEGKAYRGCPYGGSSCCRTCRSVRGV